MKDNSENLKTNEPVTLESEAKNETLPDNQITEVPSSEKISIRTTDEINKSDGTVVLGEVIDDKVVDRVANIPEAIDINARIMNNKPSTDGPKKKKRRIVTSEQKKANTITSIIALIVIGIIGGTYYYYSHRITEKDFVLKEVHIELGDSIPTSISDYITWKNVDEKTYDLNIENINATKVGEYEYSITHSDVTKTGKAIVEDTKAPEVTIKNITVNVSDKVYPQDLIDSCQDLSNCSYKFNDDKEFIEIAEPKEINAYIIISDDFDNNVIKKATITVNQSTALNCVRSFNNSNYDYSDEYTFIFGSNDILIDAKRNISYKFINQSDYYSFKSQNSTYSFDNENNVASDITEYKDSFNDLKTRGEILDYFMDTRYTCN